MDRRMESLRQLKVAEVIAMLGKTINAAQSFEWPRRALIGWRHVENLERIVTGMERVDFDGCEVGMEEVKKEWRFSTNNEALVEALEGKKCSHGFKHEKIAGSRTKGTGSYPRELAVLMMSAAQVWVDKERSKAMLQSCKKESLLEHVKSGHRYYRKDCEGCVQGHGLSRPHRRKGQAEEGVLALDIAGPFVQAEEGEVFPGRNVHDPSENGPGETGRDGEGRRRKGRRR